MRYESEMQFLLDLLLTQKLTKPTQAMVKERMVEVEQQMRTTTFIRPPAPIAAAVATQQQPSTLRLQGMAELQPQQPVQPAASAAEPTPVAQTVVTSAAAHNALADRAALINSAMSGKQPRKLFHPKNS
jgi:hypothetical protein